MAQLTVKEKMVEIIQALPDDSTIEDGIERLYLLYKIEKGIDQADRGETIPHEEVRRQAEQWRK